MGIIITAYEDRVRRGRQLFRRSDVRPRKSQAGHHFDVRGRTLAHYHVQVVLKAGEVASIECECADCRKMQEAIDEIIDSGGTSFHPGISHLHGDALCKHGIACLIEMGVMEIGDILPLPRE